MEASEYNAFVAHAPLQSEAQAPSAPSSSSALSLQGKQVAIKDLYDVKGYPTGFGSPQWLETHPEKVWMGSLRCAKG